MADKRGGGKEGGEGDLIKAVKAGNIVECRRLLKSMEEGVDHDDDDHVVVDIHEKDRDGWSPIISASYHGHVDIIELILSQGANIHDRDNCGRSSILWASWVGHVAIAELLLSRGADIHDKTFYGGHTCFSYALRFNHIRLLYRLRKWPTTMAIIMLQELALIYIIDSESVIDLHQYLGRPDDCSKSDNEEDYKKDTEGNVL
jgi:hypothetical protein